MKKTTFLKLAVIASAMLLLASCSLSEEHVHTIVPIEIKAATLTAEGYEAHWKCSECGKLFRDEAGKQKTTLAALVIPKGFAKLNDGTVKKNIGSGNGAFVSPSSIPVTVNGFYMAMTETTYERWHEVYTWATTAASSTYTFANAGMEGHDGIKGAEPTAAKQEPVTGISWRDAVVWCNAASEKDGRTPVYYVGGTTDFTLDNVIRESDGTTVAAGSGKADKAVINENANGYRLPTQAEWEYAARGGDPSSEAWSYNYAGTNSESNLVNYAVYKDNSGSKTADVGTKNANSAGLYDMSGNVFEWGQDILYLSGVMRVRMFGGCYTNSGSYTTVDWCVDYNPYSSSSGSGFRVCLSSGSN